MRNEMPTVPLNFRICLGNRAYTMRKKAKNQFDSRMQQTHVTLGLETILQLQMPCKTFFAKNQPCLEESPTLRLNHWSIMIKPFLPLLDYDEMRLMTKNIHHQLGPSPRAQITNNKHLYPGPQSALPSPSCRTIT